MGRLVAIFALLLATCAVAVVAVGAGEEESGYKVRAIFDNAGFVIAGEDVKVAGVKVGTIDSVEVTEDFKAAVVLDIEEPGFQDFRRDASCIIRPQSLIGERFVECTPTARRAAGEEPPPELERIGSGAGEGQYLLPVEQTEKSVDLDLINNIYRLPYRQKLSIILNEFGAAVAGRGQDLNVVIKRANPALRELEDVLQILADQNGVLQRLARDSDTALAPLARERRSVSRFVDSAADLGEATVERRAELEGSFQRLPRFLRELRPTMQRLGGLADEMTPVLADLGDAAPDVNTLIRELGPFSTAALPAFRTLGEAGQAGIPALEASRPVIRQTNRLAQDLRPTGRLLADVLTSFEGNDGIERLMDLLFNTVAASNGYDAFGHYLRAGLLVNTCSTYATSPVGGCSSRFAPGAAATAAGASGQPADRILAATAAVLRGEDPDDQLTAKERRRIAELREGIEAMKRQGERNHRERRGAAAPQAVASPQATATPEPPPTGAASGEAATSAGDEALLEFLFGRDAP